MDCCSDIKNNRVPMIMLILNVVCKVCYCKPDGNGEDMTSFSNILEVDTEYRHKFNYTFKVLNMFHENIFSLEITKLLTR